MSYGLRASAKTEKSTVKEIFLAPGINSFCVDKFGTYDLSFSGCHTYDAATTKFFKTGDKKPVTVNAAKHRNGVRILSNVKSEFEVLVEMENGHSDQITFTEEPTKVNGKFAYRHDFDLVPFIKLTITPLSETVLFTPRSTEIFGANDCVEVRKLLCFECRFVRFVNCKKKFFIQIFRMHLRLPLQRVS